MAGWVAADGSWNVTVVDGTTLTGIQAPDGSINVIEAPTVITAPVGSMHPCGAMYVKVTTGDQLDIREEDGSLHVSVTPFKKGTQKVTVVSGSFSGADLAGGPMGLLLAVTYST